MSAAVGFKNRKKAGAASCLLSVFFLLFPFLVIFLADVFLPEQYGETYYGELTEMYRRLRETEGEKIVVIGNSNVAFGLDSALAEELLFQAGLEYSVCNFGLYGSLGTRMMMELALPCIEEGDIVIFVPELNEQSLSLFFSAKEAWYALEGNRKLFFSMSSQSKSALAGGYIPFVSQKFRNFRTGDKAGGSGIYASASFDGHGDLTQFPRPYNIMADGYDANDILTPDIAQMPEDFVRCINEYAAAVQKKGAAMFWSYAPMNEAAFPVWEEQKDVLDEMIRGAICFPLISAAEDYIMEKEWFYDSNCHLNQSGAVIRTVQLVNDLKNELGNTTKTMVVLPEKPVIPQKGMEGEGDNSCAQYFLYEQEGNYYIVTGLTEEGSRQTELTVPYQVDGLYVKAFLPETFAGNKFVQRITVQENIHTLSDGSFNGCVALKEIVLCHDNPADISVAYGLMGGTPASCRVLVPQEAKNLFQNNYFWSYYATKIYGY